MRRRLALLAGAASDVRESIQRARRRKRVHPVKATEQPSAEEIKRRLDETRRRLQSEIPPRADPYT